MSSQSRQFREIAYTLLREYGGPAVIYRLGSSETNTRTGLTTRVIQRWPLKLAAKLPENSFTRFLYDQAHSALGSNFSMGGYLDGSLVTFGVDSSDLPKDFRFKPEDYIVQKGRRYVYDTFKVVDDSGLIIVNCKQSDSDVFVQVHDIYHNDVCGLTGENNGAD